MGKYSLENYEKYKAYKIRPRQLHSAPNNKGRGQFQTIKVKWKDLEPERGDYDLHNLLNLISKATNPVLQIEAEAPSWVREHTSEYFASFIRKVGSALIGFHQLEGIIITEMEASSQEWDAFIDAFDEHCLLADINNFRLIKYLTIHNIPFGLIVPCSESNWIDCCEKFAAYNLQEIWKKRPVLLQIEDDSCGTHIGRQALAWHASMANLNMNLGYCISLRRLTYPKQVSSGGALPLRFWFVNTGSAPCYHDFTVRIRLQKGDKIYEIPLNTNGDDWSLGDITYNEIVKLPEVIPGNYTLSLGIFFKDHSPMRLNMDCKKNGGFYELGMIEIDLVDRKEYFHIWDDYYPEGYYPLEDPQSPDENQ